MNIIDPFLFITVGITYINLCRGLNLIRRQHGTAGDLTFIPLCNFDARNNLCRGCFTAAREASRYKYVHVCVRSAFFSAASAQTFDMSAVLWSNKFKDVWRTGVLKYKIDLCLYINSGGTHLLFVDAALKWLMYA